MTFSVSNTFSGKTRLDPDELDTNFNEIESKLNNGITDDNIASGAGINTSKLAARDFGIVLTLKASSAEWQAASAGDVLAIASLPTNLSESWTLVGFDWACTDTGLSTGAFRVESGAFSAGAWTAESTLISATTIANGAGNNDANGAVSSTFNTTSFITTAGTAKFIALVMNTDDSNTLTGAPDFLVVNLFVKRASGLGTF